MSSAAVRIGTLRVKITVATEGKKGFIAYSVTQTHGRLVSAQTYAGSVQYKNLIVFYSVT